MLAFIGFIVLLIFGKFLWDTYVTGKTDKDWESHKKNEPEKAARITNSATFDMSSDYKPNSMHQQASLNMIAAQLQCESSEAKETYQNVIREELANEAGSFEQFKQSIKEIRQHKYKQALSMQFDPDDTPAAFMERWMQELLDEVSKPSVIININAKDYLAKANEAIAKNNREEAIDLLEKSLLYIDKKSPHYLQNAVGECYLALHLYIRAYDCFKKAWCNVILFELNNKTLVDKIITNKDNTLLLALIESTEAIKN
ncbi:hypothetical protein A0257_20065 [Hymenobacter psoromatis]|nr:hypothetical protein A0257_20065 [Hymenobacter psoromatis]